MLTVDIASLLQPVTAENPVGENLEYDTAFLELERIAQPKPEQQMGGTIIPGEPPNAKLVFEQATELCKRTKDLRVANILTQALVFGRGFEGLGDGLQFIHGLIEQYWASVHPELDPDDDNDPTMRLTALAGLTTSDQLRALRTAPLIMSRSFGPIGLREVAIANGELPQPDEGPKYEAQTIEAAFLDVELETLVALDETLTATKAWLQKIEAVFDEKAGASPDLAPLARLVDQAIAAVHPRVEERRAQLAEEAAAAAEAEEAGEQAPVKARRITGEIASREDVLRTLDKLCAYYAKYEPSSPLPLLLKRCQRLVPMSFKEIVGDLAPDALAKVELIAGKSED